MTEEVPDDYSVPVWAGNSGPLRLYGLNSDEWTASLEDLNSRKYDHVKLFRTSFNVDIGIAPLSLILGFDGSLLIPRVMPRDKAIVALNRHLTELFLGGLYSEAITPDNVSPGELNVWGYHRHSHTRGTYANLSQGLRSRQASPDDLIRLLGPKLIKEEEYRTLHHRGKKVMALLPSNISTVLLPAATAFCQEEWERCLILAWASSELVLDKLWQIKIVKATSIDGVTKARRKDFLGDTRTWSASTRIELLWARDLLSSELYALLDGARAARNAFIHSAKPCGAEQARSSIMAALCLVEVLAHSEDVEFSASSVLGEISGFCPSFMDAPKKVDWDEVKAWRYPDPAPGFKDWGDTPFPKLPEIQLKPVSHPEG